MQQKPVKCIINADARSRRECQKLICNKPINSKQQFHIKQIYYLKKETTVHAMRTKKPGTLISHGNVSNSCNNATLMEMDVVVTLQEWVQC